MNPVEIDEALKSMRIIVDTKEQNTELLHKRCEGFNCPHIRRHLDFGDYSAEYTASNGQVISIEKIAVVERKMSLDEICNNFTGRERLRFKREFQRANGARIYLLIEGGKFEAIYQHRYRSRLNTNSLLASLLSFSIRYNLRIIFCDKATTGMLIKDIMHYELREHLMQEGEENA